MLTGSEYLDVVILLSPMIIGGLVGWLLSFRKEKVDDLSWRKEPTVRMDYRTDPDVDYLGRREPTLNVDPRIPTVNEDLRRD